MTGKMVSKVNVSIAGMDIKPGKRKVNFQALSCGRARFGLCRAMFTARERNSEGSTGKFMTRSQSRESRRLPCCLKESFNPETDMDDIISLSLENELIEPDEFASMLAQTAWDKLFSIDDIIEKYSKNWKKHRISRVALSAMRLSILRAYVHTGSPGRHFNKRGCRAV